MPGWPLPTFCTASAARTRTVSTARTSRSVHFAFRATGREISGAPSLGRALRAVRLLRGGRGHVGPLCAGRIVHTGGSGSAPSTLVSGLPHRGWRSVDRVRRRLESTEHPDCAGTPKDAVATTSMPDRPVGPRGPIDAARSANYVALTKPRIIELLLVTTVPVMVLAAGGVPVAVARPGAPSSVARWRPARPTPSTATSTATSTRSCSARATARWSPGEISPRDALVFGVAAHRRLDAAGSRWPSTCCPAVLVASPRSRFYVVGYTMLLKRRTPQNIVWGGAAGCMPVLIGWAAVTGTRAAGRRSSSSSSSSSGRRRTTGRCRCAFRDDYAAAGVPMLPVVAAPGRRRPPDRRVLVGHGRDLARPRARWPRWAGSTPSPRCSPARCSSSRRTACCRPPRRGADRHGARSRCGCSTTRSPT